MRQTEATALPPHAASRAWPCLAVLLLLAVTTGCVSIPEPLRGDYPELAPANVTVNEVGRPVRWGGVILDAKAGTADTCFEILSRPLDSSMRPETQDQTTGRFIACANGFHDPAVFASGREVTLTGSIRQIDEGKVGEFDYRFPVVAAQFITMWPERPDVVIYDDPFYDPWYWGPYRYPYHYPYPYRPYPRTYHSGSSGSRTDIQQAAPVTSGSQSAPDPRP